MPDTLAAAQTRHFPYTLGDVNYKTVIDLLAHPPGEAKTETNLYPLGHVNWTVWREIIASAQPEALVDTVTCTLVTAEAETLGDTLAMWTPRH